MNAAKQELFVERVLFLHSLAVRRGGRYGNLKLTLNDWNAEADRMAFVGYVLEKMTESCDSNGDPLFKADVLQRVRVRALEGYLA